jgi:hypothetical protein
MRGGEARRMKMRSIGDGGFKAENIQICIYTDLYFPEMSNKRYIVPGGGGE